MTSSSTAKTTTAGGNSDRSRGSEPQGEASGSQQAEHERPSRSAASRPRTRARKAAEAGVGVATGEATRRRVTDATDLKTVIEVARRVGCRQTQGLTDDQVLRWLAEKPGRLRTLGGHVFEHLD